MSHLHDGHFTAGLDADPELAASIRGELRRQREGIELIASENIVSRLVLEAQGSVLTNKTVEGLPFGRYYGGAEFADAIEELTIRRACQVFGCRFANVQPHSGSNANAGVLLGLLELGDPILSMDIAAGGHISHGHPATLTGRDYTIATYGVNRETELIDLEEVRDLAFRSRPKLIIAGGSAYSRAIDFAGLRAIADEVDAYLMVDMAHCAGLVAHWPLSQSVPPCRCCDDHDLQVLAWRTRRLGAVERRSAQQKDQLRNFSRRARLGDAAYGGR
jgi:glycine hydroxymethyltransferase